MSDLFQLIVLGCIICGAIVLGIYKSKKDEDPFRICLIRIMVYIFITVTPVLTFWEFIHANQTKIEVSAQRIGDKEDGVIELKLSNNSQSFGVDFKLKYLVVLYEEANNDFVVKKSTGILQSNELFLPPKAKDSTYIIELKNCCVSIGDIFNELDSLKRHKIAVYILIDSDVPFIPYMRNQVNDILLYKPDLSKFYTIAGVDKYQGKKKLKTERIFQFLKKENSLPDFNNFLNQINKM